uniref:Uncharacterized protein n=1 Tax=Vitrella brassicaformis TaxID=1169539 RepID=A0A7S1PCG0_9ALVE
MTSMRHHSNKNGGSVMKDKAANRAFSSSRPGRQLSKASQPFPNIAVSQASLLPTGVYVALATATGGIPSARDPRHSYPWQGSGKEESGSVGSAPQSAFRTRASF